MNSPFHKTLLAANDGKAPHVGRRSLKTPELPQFKERAVARLRSKTTRNAPEPVAPGQFTAHFSLEVIAICSSVSLPRHVAFAYWRGINDRGFRSSRGIASPPADGSPQ